jgi:ABC-2 type transport system ATP-binding protein
MRAIDLFRYSASFYHKDCTKRIAELADILQLDLHKKIEDMSLGNKKKVGIVQAFCIRRASSYWTSRRADWIP